MIRSSKGASNEYGSETRVYQVGEELETKEQWQKTLAQSFLDEGSASEIGGNQEVPETKKAPIKKGRKAKPKT